MQNTQNDNEVLPRWNKDHLLSLMPGAKEAFPSTGEVDQEKLTALYHDFFGNLTEQARQLCAHPIATGESSPADREQLTDFFDAYDRIEVLHARFKTFTAAMNNYAAGMQPYLIQSLGSTAAEMDEGNLWLLKVERRINKVCRGLDGETLSDPALAHYLPLIRRELESPMPPENASALVNDSNALMLNALQMMGATQHSKDPAARDGFNQGIITLVTAQNLMAKGGGYSDTSDKFYKRNHFSADALGRVLGALETRGGGILHSLSTCVEKARQDERTYSWAEAKEIIIAAYSRLGPEFEQVVREAFDSNNIHYSPNAEIPAVIPGLIRSEAGGGHGLLVTNYAGKTKDVLFLGHEIGHYLAEYFALGTQSQATATHNMMVHEAFSHFGEELMRDALLEHAATPRERAAIAAGCAQKKIETLLLAPNLEWERKLYAHLASGKPPLTGGELERLYIDCAEKYLGSVDLDGFSMDMRDQQGLMNMLAQPFYSGIYPTDVLAAGALKEACDRDPQAFGAALKKLMQRGSDVGINEVWDALLGRGVAQDPAFFDRCADAFLAQIERDVPMRDASAFKSARPAAPSSIRPDSAHIHDRSGRARGLSSEE